MKKYFIVETDEELQFGDKVKLDLTKEAKHTTHKIEGELVFNSISLPFLLDMGIIEEREVEEEEANTDKDELLDFGDEPCEALEALEEDFECLEEKVEQMEALLEDVHTWSNSAAEKISSLEDELVLLKKRVSIIEASLKTGTSQSSQTKKK